MPKRLSDEQLIEALNLGKTQTQIAKEFGISDAAVSKRIKQLKKRKTTDIILSGPITKEPSQKTTVIERIEKLNTQGTEILDLLMGWIRGEEKAKELLEKRVRTTERGCTKDGDPIVYEDWVFKNPIDGAVKSINALRGLHELQLEMFKTFYSMQAAEEFMEVVLEVIKSVDSATHNRIVQELFNRRLLGSTVQRIRTRPGPEKG